MKNVLFKRNISYVEKILVYICLFMCILVLNQCISSGIPDLTGIDIPGSDRLMQNLIEGEPPLTTDIKDAVYEDKSMDKFKPKAFIPLAEMPRNNQGGFFLLPGVYRFDSQSYCLKAGTYSPRTGGPGYVYAPLKGGKSEIVRHILQRSVDHPEIEQEDIQILLWAIIARTKIKDMSDSMKQTANKLLTRKEIFELNGGALGMIPEDAFYEAIGNLPEPVQQVFEAERQLREMLTESTSYTYDEVEEIAVLTGIEPPELLLRKIPSGRWSKHPDGYYIRYYSSGYSETRIELYCPPDKGQSSFSPWVSPVKGVLIPGNTDYNRVPCYNGSGGSGLRQFNPDEGAAIPGNTGCQRLGCSGRKPTDADSPLGKIRTGTTWLNNIGTILGPETFVPSLGVSKILDFNFDTWGSAISALQGDPPRSDYKVYEKPVPIAIPPIQPGNGITASQAKYLNELLSSASHVTSLYRASIITQDRIGGALRANDNHWASEQAKVLCYYKRETGLAMIDFAEKFGNIFKVFKEKRIQDVYISAQMIRDYQENLRKKGFSKEALEAARILKISRAELKKMKQERLSADPEENEGYLSEIIKNLVESLKNGGKQWALIPEVDPYWL